MSEATQSEAKESEAKGSEASAPQHDHADHAHEGHSTNYVKIWGILVVLLIISVLGPMLGIKVVTLITAFGIAIVKAYLVVKNFMHLNLEPKYLIYALATSLFLMGLFFIGTAPDVMEHAGAQWVNVAAQQAAERAMHPQPEHPAEPEGPFDAAATFASVCGACHGAEGRGDGPAAAALNPHPANFTDPEFWATRDAAHVARVIRGGGASVGRSPTMPSFSGRFTDEQIEALAQHVASLAPAEVAAADAGAGDAATTDGAATDGAASDAGAEPADERATEAPEASDAPEPEALPEAAE